MMDESTPETQKTGKETESKKIRALLGEMKARLASLWGDPAVRYGVVTFLVVRLALAGWMFAVRQVYAQPLPPHPVSRPYLGVQPEENPWLEPWQRWDTLHYQAIAERGYTAFNSALFTPPMLPLLMRGVSVLTGGNTLVAGIAVSNLALFPAFLVWARAGRHAWVNRAILYLSWSGLLFMSGQFAIWG